MIIALAVVANADGGDTRFQVHRIAHAGGGLGRTTYTNSYQALTTNINKGFKYMDMFMARFGVTEIYTDFLIP